MTADVDRPPRELASCSPPHPAAPRRRVRPQALASWIVLLIGLGYFFLPLVGTLLFSLRARPFLAAYTDMIKDPQVWYEPRLLVRRSASSRSS